MLKQCKPNAKGEFPVLTEDEQDKFVRYGMIDTQILREVYYKTERMEDALRIKREADALRAKR
jgi:hypothetical protein